MILLAVSAQACGFICDLGYNDCNPARIGSDGVITVYE